jgi:hypothetical protein
MAPIVERLDEIRDALAEPEQSLAERVLDPRRFKFDWQP